MAVMDWQEYPISIYIQTWSFRYLPLLYSSQCCSGLQHPSHMPPLTPYPTDSYPSSCSPLWPSLPCSHPSNPHLHELIRTQVILPILSL